MDEQDHKAISDLADRAERREITGASIDSRSVKAGELFVALPGERCDGHDFVADALQRGAWGALVARDALAAGRIALAKLPKVVAVANPLLALQELALLLRRRIPIPLVGVTGSNGKTTTKEMLSRILEQGGPVLRNEGNLNNHIGVPLTLLRLRPGLRAAIVEMGMSAPGEIALLARIAAPQVGVVTNIGPAHLEFLGSMEGVADAKGELLEGLPPDGTAIVNADDVFVDRLRSKFSGRTISFGLGQKAVVRAKDIHQGVDQVQFTIAYNGSEIAVQLRTVGAHNVYNALAAAAGALAAGASLEDVRAGLGVFVPVAGRSELRTIKGRTILADYYNANPASLAAALAALVGLAPSGRTVAVLGDMRELGAAGEEAHREAGRRAARSGVFAVVTLGRLARLIGEGAREAGLDRVYEAATHDEAAELLFRLAQPGDAVLIKGSRGMQMEKILEGC